MGEWMGARNIKPWAQAHSYQAISQLLPQIPCNLEHLHPMSCVPDLKQASPATPLPRGPLPLLLITPAMLRRPARDRCCSDGGRPLQAPGALCAHACYCSWCLVLDLMAPLLGTSRLSHRSPAHPTLSVQRARVQVKHVLLKPTVIVQIMDSLTGNFRTDFTGRGELADRQQKLGQMLSRLRKVGREWG